MDAERIEAIRGRVEAAIEGPWDRHDFGYAGEQEPSSIVVHTGKFDWEAVRDGETVIAGMGWDAQENANAEFIAHARTDVPDLLAEVERLEDLHGKVYSSWMHALNERDALRAENKRLHNWLDNEIATQKALVETYAMLRR